MKTLIKRLFTREKKDDVKRVTLANETTSNVLKATNTIAEIGIQQPLAMLKKFAPLRNLNDEELQQIEQSTVSYAPETIIFVCGEKGNKIYYLLQGTIEFTSNGGHVYSIDEKSAVANLPINSGKICGATAVAQSYCTVLAVPITVLHWWENESKNKLVNGAVDFLNFALPKEIPATLFFNELSLACRENKLTLPILPQVAIRLRKAMTEDIGINEAVKILQLDTIIVTRLIQLANSALYTSVQPVTNCHGAVSRLGLKTTSQLVMSISVKQLFQSNSPQLMLKMKNLWQKSVYISSVSFILAQESRGTVNPEDALLAGLICDIGAIPLLHFAEKNAEIAPDLDELQSAMRYLNPNVGAFVLHQLNFSNELVDVAKQGENWHYESGQDGLTLIDVVILAKFHSYLGTNYAAKLPHITSIPAYTKLRNGKLNPDFSLDVLAKAKQRINKAIEVLS